MSRKTFRITCQGAALIHHRKISEFQGELKSLSRENYERLKGEILELGFSEPLSLWQSKEIDPVTGAPILYVLNGHQRLRTVRQMEHEGYFVPMLPVVFVEADSPEQAARKCLALTSQYGKIEHDGLYAFMHAHGIGIDELEKSFRFPEVKMASFREEFFEPKQPKPEKAGQVFKLEISFPDAETRQGVFDELSKLGYEVKLK